ncbi:universal stress protein [Streptomyces sp. TRM49041]|uniref:universal stress protein n=1 Tax=Streptomyces sp. TRM49041 TaxID=2603216 RepID=UPI0011EBA60A|nr:universal stress protein [Streptomyces sp. TRM49041]
MEPVVTVGLDGSPESMAAAHRAADEAERRSVTPRLVHARPMPTSEPTHVPSETDHNYRAERGQVLRPWREKSPGLEPADAIRPESPAKAVVRAAEGAEPLVVGRRKHRPALASRLGRVAHAALPHARCPVTVVPHD